MELKFDFPPDVVRERGRIYSQIEELLTERTTTALRQARQMHLDWLNKFPGDYVALDAGEQILMMEEALEILAREQSAESVAA